MNQVVCGISQRKIRTPVSHWSYSTTALFSNFMFSITSTSFVVNVARHSFCTYILLKNYQFVTSLFHIILQFRCRYFSISGLRNFRDILSPHPSSCKSIVVVQPSWLAGFKSLIGIGKKLWTKKTFSAAQKMEKGCSFWDQNLQIFLKDPISNSWMNLAKVFTWQFCYLVDALSL